MSAKSKYVSPLVPEKCPVCGAEWKGGSEVPGNRMNKKSLIAYNCGASLSVKLSKKTNSFSIVVENCWCDDNIKAESGVDKIANPADFDPFSRNIPLELKHYHMIVDDNDAGGKQVYAIELDEGEAKIRYGEGVVPIFSTQRQAKDYIDKIQNELPEEEKSEIVRVRVRDVYNNLIDWVSHVIVDPEVSEDGEIITVEDNLISDLTVLEF